MKNKRISVVTFELALSISIFTCSISYELSIDLIDLPSQLVKDASATIYLSICTLSPAWGRAMLGFIMILYFSWENIGEEHNIVQLLLCFSFCSSNIFIIILYSSWENKHNIVQLLFCYSFLSFRLWFSFLVNFVTLSLSRNSFRERKESLACIKIVKYFPCNNLNYHLVGNLAIFFSDL